MNIPSFDSFDLEIDYLSFNLNSQDRTQVQKIADYLAQDFKCKSSIQNSKTNYKEFYRLIQLLNFLKGLESQHCKKRSLFYMKK